MGAGASADISRNAELVDDLDRLVKKQQRFVNVAFNQRQRGALVHVEGRTEPLTLPSGSAVYLWKQDPSVTRVGIRKVYLPHKIRPGPRDDNIEVVLEIPGTTEKDHKATALANPDALGDFLADIEGDPFCFDLVHTYAVVRLTVDMYIRDLQLLDWKWNWDLNLPPGQPKTPIKVLCHAGEKANATYHRGKKCLKFYYLTVESKTGYLCRSFDIVSHETGHAVLDALKPQLYSHTQGQPGALHEAFADLTAAFACLEQLDMCEDIIAETKCDLRKADWLTSIGEQFAQYMQAAAEAEAKANGQPTAGVHRDDAAGEHQETGGMRNMNNALTGETCGKGIYEICNVFTGYVYDILVDFFAWERDPYLGESDAHCLNRCARIVRKLLLLGLFNSSEVPDFTEISHGMEKAVDVIAKSDPGDIKMYKQIIAKRREDRKLSLAGAEKREKPVDLGAW